MSLPQGIFVRWLKVNFSEVFVAWIHLKALRVFVESALRSVLIKSVISSQHLSKNGRKLIIFLWSQCVRWLIIISPSRYGLPMNYQALLLQTDRKRSKKLREELSSLFMHLDPTASKTDVRASVTASNIVYDYDLFHLKHRRKSIKAQAHKILEPGCLLLTSGINMFDKTTLTQGPLTL